MGKEGLRDCREHVFANDRPRVATVIRDYGMTERKDAPADSRAINDAITPR